MTCYQCFKKKCKRPFQENFEKITKVNVLFPKNYFFSKQVYLEPCVMQAGCIYRAMKLTSKIMNRVLDLQISGKSRKTFGNIIQCKK